jgi:hypothetical protein
MFYLPVQVLFKTSFTPNRLHDVAIKYKNETKFWGLYLFEHWNWEVNIKTLGSNLSKSYYDMQSLKGKMSLNIMRCICQIFTHIWGTAYFGEGG